MKMSQLKHDTPKSNLNILEWMNEIPIYGETYSEIPRHQFTLYSTFSCPLLKDYMETSRSEWEEDNYFTPEHMRAMALKKYNTLSTSGRWHTKDTEDDQILALVGVTQKLADNSKKSSEKPNTSNRDTTKGEQYYIRELSPWMLEEPKGGVGNKKSMENNTVGKRNTALAKTSGSTTIQKKTGSGPAPRQAAGETLIHQARETATRS